MVTSMARGTKHPIDREMRWNFGHARGTPLSLDEFLAQKEADGVEFFAGKEPWLKGISKLNWQTFFRVCTQEMDDLSQRAVKLVIEYCLDPDHFLQHPIARVRSGDSGMPRIRNVLRLNESLNQCRKDSTSRGIRVKYLLWLEGPDGTKRRVCFCRFINFRLIVGGAGGVVVSAAFRVQNRRNGPYCQSRNSADSNNPGDALERIHTSLV